MMEAEKKLAKNGDEDAWVDDYRKMCNTRAVERGEQPLSKEEWAARLRAELGGAPGSAGPSRQLTEEIAATRYILRTTLTLALDTPAAKEYVHLVEVYGKTCNRLLRLLWADKANQGNLADLLRRMINKVLKEFCMEVGIIPSGREEDEESKETGSEACSASLNSQ